jgi:Sigma-70 factor, region 1.1
MELQTAIRRAVELGRQTGFITFDQLNELLRATEIEPDDIATIMEALSDAEINIVDEP